MANRSNHRDAIVAAATGLFRLQGYAATGLAEILQASGAPKGSLYHYFPAGKRTVAIAAIRFGGAAVTNALTAMASGAVTPAALLRTYVAAAARDLEASGWRAGCPIATILLETAADDDGIAAAGDAVLAEWRAVFVQCAIGVGIAPNDAEALSLLAISAVEGGLLQARAARSAVPLIRVGEMVATMFDDAQRTAAEA